MSERTAWVVFVACVMAFLLWAMAADAGAQEPRIDGQGVTREAYTCPDLPGDGVGAGSGPRWNAALPESVTRWKQLVADVFNAYCAPYVVEDALRVLACESVGDPDAYNGATGVSGLFQIDPLWWHLLDDLGFTGISIFDPHANVALGAYIWRTTGGWWHWSCNP